MPFASQAQRGLMYATEEGAHTGVPKSVAHEFIAHDKPGKLPEHVARGGGIGAHLGMHLDTTAIPHTNLSVPGFGASMAKAPKPPEGVRPTTWQERSEARQIDRGFAVGGGIGHAQFGGDMAGSSWPERTEANEISAPHGGFLNSSIAGRTDRLPIAVAADSHVLPADVLSGLGQDNSLSGARVMSAALRIGPYGTAHPQGVRGPGPPSHHPPSLPGEERELAGGIAEGGKPKDEDAKIAHCLMAGGEMVIPPHDWTDGQSWYRGVRSIGKGDIEKGHALLRELTKRVRAHHIKFLTHAPPPKK